MGIVCTVLKGSLRVLWIIKGSYLHGYGLYTPQGFFGWLWVLIFMGIVFIFLKGSFRVLCIVKGLSFMGIIVTLLIGSSRVLWIVKGS